MKRNSYILLLDKKEDITSFSSLNYVKKTIDKKVGHCGTLDKFASGLMIVLTNKFTKLNPLFSNQDKTYQAVFYFGKETETLDPEGKVIKETRIPTLKEIETAIETNLKGKIMQEPPIFSAIHVNGKRSYDLARKNQIQSLPKREVTIYDFKIISYVNNLLTCVIKVSKGTYIRSIARDLGVFTKSSCYVQNLRRLSIGKYSLEDVCDLEKDDLEKFTEKMLLSLDLKTYNLNENENKVLEYGRLPKLDKGLIRLDYNEKTQAIVQNNKIMVLLK